MLDDLVCWVISIHHHKVGMRIDRLKRSCHSLIKEFLTVVQVASDKVIHAGGVVERGCSSLSNEGIDIVFGGKHPHSLNCFRECHGVTKPQTCQSVNCGEGTRDNDFVIPKWAIDK